MAEKWDRVISETAEKAAKLCSPFRIYLVSQKKNYKGNITSFKLCLIVPDDVDTDKCESMLLMEIDTPVPCDYIVYNVSAWNEYVYDDSAFAYRIENSGALLYE